MSVYWLSFATKTPPRSFPQEELFRLAGYSDFSPEERRTCEVIFRASGVKRRAMWFAEGNDKPSNDPDDFHHRYMSGIRKIAPEVALQALEKLGLKGGDLDFLVFASCTGYTCPGFSAELAYTLGMPPDRPTANLLGMGCSALVPALERARDHLVAKPGSRAIVLAAEICSATYWIDHDPETVVGNALFGDGATAIVLSSRKEDLERLNGNCAGVIQGFKTLRDGRFISEMGFTQKEGRLRLRLSREIPDKILPLAIQLFDSLELEAGARVAFHPGGKRVLDLLGAALSERSEKWRQPIGWAREVLRFNGNMSSPTVAFVLEHSIKERPIVHGEVSALVAMGPGLSVEGVRIQWLSGG